MKEKYLVTLFSYIDWSWIYWRIQIYSLFYFPAVPCGGRVQTGGWLSSPGYPQYMDSNIDCVWDIKAPLGHVVLLTVVDLDYYSNPLCNRGWLAVGYNHTSQRDITMCLNSDVGRTIISPSNTMRIFYHSSSYYGTRRFNITLSSQGRTFFLCSCWKCHTHWFWWQGKLNILHRFYYVLFFDL